MGLSSTSNLWTGIIGTLRGPRGPKNSRKKRHLRRMKHHKGYKWMGLDGNLWNIKDTKWRPQRWCERRWWELGAASRDRIISWQSSTPRYEWKVLPGWCWWWWLRYCVECFMSRYLNKPFCIFGIYDRPLGSSTDDWGGAGQWRWSTLSQNSNFLEQAG